MTPRRKRVDRARVARLLSRDIDLCDVDVADRCGRLASTSWTMGQLRGKPCSPTLHARFQSDLHRRHRAIHIFDQSQRRGDSTCDPTAPCAPLRLIAAVFWNRW